MVMKTYIKLLFRTLKSNVARFLILMSIIAIGVGLSTGIGILPNQLENSFQTFFNKQKYPSLIIKGTESTENLGQILNQLKALPFVLEVDGLIEFDQEDGTRTYILDLNEQTVNHLTLVEGELPKEANQILVEKKTNKLVEYQIGETILYHNPSLGMFNQSLEVVGIVQNPLLVYRHDIPSNIDQNLTLERVIYFDQALMNIPFITDIHVLLKVPTNLDLFTAKYRQAIDYQITDIQRELQDESLIYLAPNEALGYAVVQTNILKMKSLSFIFPAFFTLVIMIVAITSIRRLIEEERLQTGALLSLGMGKGKINFRYYFIGLFASIIGSILGIVLGYNTLARLIYAGFDSTLVMPQRTHYIHLEFGLMVSFFLFMVTMLAILIASVKQTREKPAALLRHKAPKTGSKIILEKIKPLWNKLKFTQKSTLRNLFRYPLHDLMTITSVMGATALIFAGLGLYDNTQTIDQGVAQFIEIIAVLIILAAAGLSILVTYNLTNMNIDERKRELATLKVLGYHKLEVRRYVYREVFMIASIGTLLGLPVGYYIIGFIFEYIEYGHVDNIHWYSWFLVVAISLIFIGITNLLLLKKIDRIDMNTSLKIMD